MVCDGAAVLNLVASVMMNGMCCIHTMNEEEERQQEQRNALRKAINVEWQRQRLLEIEHHEKMLREQGMDAATIMAEERRRLLMTTKMAAASQASPSSGRASPSITRVSPMSIPPRQKHHRPHATTSATRGRRAPPPEPTAFNDTVGMDRSRSAPATPSRATAIDQPRIPLVIGEPVAARADEYATKVSSLMDDNDDDDDDDDEVETDDGFDEVKLT